jgi:hypothetical protein
MVYLDEKCRMLMSSYSKIIQMKDIYQFYSSSKLYKFPYFSKICYCVSRGAPILCGAESDLTSQFLASVILLLLLLLLLLLQIGEY